jgi:hypothetical protein
MTKIFLFVCVFGFLTITSFGQTASCTQTLRLAQSTYEQGRLHEIPTILKTCLDNGGFTQQEKVNAYKILINSYIYLEEPELADETMLKLLNADHFFEINEAVDPAEFIALYRTFRVKPLFRFGFKVGPTATMPAMTQLFSVGSDAQGNGKFAPKINFSFGLVFEKDFDGFIKNFSIAPELVYVARAYNYSNSTFTASDENPDETIISQISNLHSQQWLDLNLLVQYKFKESSLNPYFSVGPGISYLLGSTNELSTKVEGQGTITGSAVPTEDSYKTLAYSAIFSVGSKIRLGGFYLTGDIRYQLGLRNVVDESNRSNDVVVFDYAYVPSDYRLNNLTVNLGLVIPYFNPIKQIGKK